jgi:phosphorylase kinase alpha/beta subunit
VLLEPDRTSFYRLMQEIASGQVDDVPVMRGRLVELLPTASFERVDDLHDLKLPSTPFSSTAEQLGPLPRREEQIVLELSAERSVAIATDASALAARVAQTNNLYERIALLEALVRMSSLDGVVQVAGGARVLQDLIEDVYDSAGRLHLWSVVRRAAGLLGKVDGDLSLAVGAILVRQKAIQVGRSYSDGSLVTTPIPEHELLAKIASFSREDVRDRVLVQELILYLGLLIKAEPELFDEILTIRVSHLVTLLSTDLGREFGLSPDEAYERLTQLPPSELQRRVESALQQYNTLEQLPQQLDRLKARGTRGGLGWDPDLGFDGLDTPEEGWLHWRQHAGIVDRRPPGFYANVWHIFRHTPALVIGDRLDRRNRMDSSVVLSDMTQEEQSFALWLEHLLNKIGSPEYRQLMVEALRVLSSFLEQHQELQIQDPIVLDAVIGHAVHLAYVAGDAAKTATYNEHKSEAWDAFYSRPPSETSDFFVAAFRHLLASHRDSRPPPPAP